MSIYTENKQRDLTNEMSKLVAEQKKQSKHFKKQNRLAQQQIEQSQLKIEQTERLYLLEKSKLQPKFKLSVTEFLLCSPDFMADPEQAVEAQFLTDLGVNVDDRVLRFQMTVVEKGQYLRPHLVVARKQTQDKNDNAFAMSGLLYFLPFNMLADDTGDDAFDVFWVYRDQTTLPVVQKYRVSQRQSTKLTRWDVMHIDTVFALAKDSPETLNSSLGCEKLFGDRT